MTGRSKVPLKDFTPTAGVSVIVYSHEGDEGLEPLLEQIFAQDYTGEKEVIVVNDGRPTQVQEIVGRLQHYHENLYLTYLPDGSRNLSRKKMALTLGIKAANYEILLLTCSNCRLLSPSWMRAMVEPFYRGKEVVLGYAVPTSPDGPLTGLKKFDFLYGSITYLSAAILGHPYRGTEFNIAYRRTLFFQNRGFSAHQNMVYGDDDIFISQIANGENTRVVLSPESIVEVKDENLDKTHRMWRMRYDFTSRYLHTWAPFVLGTGTAFWWVLTGTTIAISLAALPSLLFLAVCVPLWLLMWIWLAMAWKRCAKALDCTLGWFSPLALLWHPIYGWKCRLTSRKNRERNFTWKQQA